MTNSDLELCPGCRAQLPQVVGPTHRYIGASASCWALFTALNNGGEPPMTPAPIHAMLIDAYAVQHPGQPSPQAIQSVVVHLLTLYGVFVAGVAIDKTVWIRQRALRQRREDKRDRMGWLSPPSFAGSLTINDIVQASTPSLRSEQANQYIKSVWSVWSKKHGATIANWYEEFVVKEDN